MIICSCILGIVYEETPVDEKTKGDGEKWKDAGFILFYGLIIFMFIHLPKFPHSLIDRIIEDQPFAFMHFTYLKLFSLYSFSIHILGRWLSTIFIMIFYFFAGFLFSMFKSRFVTLIRKRREKIKDLIKYKSNLWISVPVLLVLLIISTILLPSMMGHYAAEDLATGRGDHIQINLTLKEDNSNIKNKDLILVTQCNENYYLIEISNNSSRNSSAYLFIVPEDQIQTAVLKRKIV